MKIDIKKELKKFQYPDVVFELVSRFVDTVINVFDQDSIGILLVGSTSRGELCWGEMDGKVVFFSDIEFIIAANDVSVKNKKKLLKMIKELADTFDLGDRFHFDYVINSWSSLKSTQKKIFIFDCKNIGIELTDNSIKEILPEVTKENLDFKELNDVLLHRMKALVNDVPDDVFDKGSNHRDFVLSIAKNTLDITTWLYPYESDKLVSGFKQRVMDWDKKRSEMILNHYFDEDDFIFLHECLSIRESPIDNYDGNELLKKCVTIFRKAIEYCKAMNQISHNEAINSHSVSKKLFSEYKLRRRFAEAYLLFKHRHLFNIESLVANIFLPRKGKQTQFCFTMLQAIIENLNQPNTKNHHLTKANKELNALLKAQRLQGVKFSDNWLALRREYIMLNEIFI